MQYGKFTHVLALLATIPVKMTGETAIQAIDHMLEYMHAHFAPPSHIGEGRGMYEGYMPEEMRIHAKKCSEMLRSRETPFVDLLETIPPHFSEVLFPICVMRYMLRELSMPFNHRESLYFAEFHRRYGALILANY
jgi:hypothetical protein